MKRFKTASVFLSLLLFLSFAVSVAAGSNNALVILDPTNITSIQETRNFIKEEGGRITHIYPPHILIGHIPEDIVKQLIREKEIVSIHYGLVDTSTVEKYGKTTVYAVEAWNNNFMGLARNRGLVPSLLATEPPPIKGDALIPPDEDLEPKPGGLLSKAAPFGATLRDTSEYMIGDIAVGIIMMESNGTIDSSTENWTGAEESDVVSEIQAAMNWWALREPNANLTFTYDINTGVATGYEPISRPSTDQYLWITEAMTALGYTTFVSYFDNVHDYDGAIRDANNADWGFTIFVVDSSADGDNKFTDTWFAYAYYGGPFMVMTYGNNGYGIANMDAVTAHEMGHIFYALDEYLSAGKDCTDRIGYLNIEHQNNEGGCLTDVACIMRGQIAPFSNGNICTYSAQQIGWRDTNSNGIQDIVDTFPNTILNAYAPDPTTNNTPTYTGSAAVVPYLNSNIYGNGNDITINTLDDIEYRIDGGTWTAANADDGTFDEDTETFNFTPSPLSGATYLFETRATNSVLNIESSYASDSLTINTILPNAPSGLSATAASSSRINLNWTDNSNNEDGFKIERKTGITGSYSQIDTVGIDVITYSDSGLSALTEYYYQVRAYNAAGDSTYSNEDNATTLKGSSAAAGGDGGGGGGGSGCFIATAAYGSYMADEVMMLREFRDKYLLTNSLGREFVSLYYTYSPPIAEVIKGNEFLRTVTRVFLTPVVMGIAKPYRSLAVFIVFLFAAIALRLIRRQKALTT